METERNRLSSSGLVYKQQNILIVIFTWEALEAFKLWKPEQFVVQFES